MKSSQGGRIAALEAQLATVRDQNRALAQAVLDLEKRMSRIEADHLNDEPPDNGCYLDGTTR